MVARRPSLRRADKATPLGMVARAGSDHAFFKRLLRQLGHFVVRHRGLKENTGCKIFSA